LLEADDIAHIRAWLDALNAVLVQASVADTPARG
jgi:hypothetical protein